MNTRITSDDVAKQFGEAIRLLLEWARQEMHPNAKFISRNATIGEENNDLQNSIDPEKLLKAQEVAKILQISRSLAYRLMQHGEIPSVRFHQSIRVRQKDLEAFIKQNRKSGEE